jgi:hypothetical protein
VLLFFLSSAFALDPAFTETIEVYHVNPAHYGPTPINMDTADLEGDAFFDLRSVTQPLECADTSHSKYTPTDCTNPEVIANDLVITKLELEVDKRFGNYAMCNVCINGSASISGHCNSTQEGGYVCSCHGGGGTPEYACSKLFKKCFPSYAGTMNESTCEESCHRSTDADDEVDYDLTSFNNVVIRQPLTAPPPSGNGCNASVGRENVTEKFSHYGCKQGSKNYQCWQANVIKKTGGLWFSTLDEGYCGTDPSTEPKNCTWRVKQVVKVVNKTCSDNSIYTKAETYDAGTQGEGCFQNASCPVGAARNTSSECWIGCFYETLLGPDAGIPGGVVAGWPTADILTAWQKPFMSNDATQGGCPAMSY